MSNEVQVEQLAKSNAAEILAVLTQAFCSSENLNLGNLGSKGNIWRIIARAISAQTYMRVQIALLEWTMRPAKYGIRVGDRLACVALLADFTEAPQPSLPSRVALRMLGVVVGTIVWLGTRSRRGTSSVDMAVELDTAMGNQDGQYLELVMIGTLPAYQKQGLGRAMLRFIYDKAVREGYSGINLCVSRSMPAFDLYLREGFECQNEQLLHAGEIAVMRKSLSGQ